MGKLWNTIHDRNENKSHDIIKNNLWKELIMEQLRKSGYNINSRTYIHKE